MTAKQKWLKEHLIIPAGILPPAIKYNDLFVYEQTRKRVGNVGFEYMLLMDQDPQKINSSPIGGKIYAVHAPLPSFSHALLGNHRNLIEFVTNLIYGKNRIPYDSKTVADKTFLFAKAVGAKIVVFHTYHLKSKIKESLAYLAQWEDKTKIIPVIEHEATYVDFCTKNKLFEIYSHDGSFAWATDPIKMIAVLDKVFPQKKFGICIDTSSLYSFSMPILSTVKQCFDRITHVHVTGSVPGKDLASEIDQPELANMICWLYEHNYSGLINAEINGTGNKLEEIIAQIYGASSILKLPILKSFAVKNAQRHIENSCKFLLENV